MRGFALTEIGKEDRLSTTTSAEGPASLEIVEILIADLAPHPANPREDLGDLTDLTASIKEIGLLEPVVVATAAAHRAGGWDPLPDGATHVLLAGHRRTASCSLAGLLHVPAVVRDDLAGGDAVITMLAENGEGIRQGLTPLAEANAMQQLVGIGWSQRRIAERLGCAQGQVSKRLSLLTLPDEAKTALNKGTISTADALELTKLAKQPDAVKSAMTSAGRGYSIKLAVRQQEEAIAREAKIEKTRKRLTSEGYTLVNSDKAFASVGGPYDRRLYLSDRDGDGDGEDGARLAVHQEAGCLVADVDFYGEPKYFCQSPDKHEPEDMPDGYRRAFLRGNGEEVAKENSRELARAAKRRTEASLELALRMAFTPGLTPAQALPLLAGAVIDRGADASTLKRAVRWLREHSPAAQDDPFIANTQRDDDAYDYARKVQQSENPALALRLALFMLVVTQEQHVRFRDNGWDAQVVSFYEQLMAEVAYEPSPWEQERLTCTRQILDARERLACPVCGCTHARRATGHHWCDVTPPESEGQEWIFLCRSCSPATPNNESADEVGEGSEDLEDLEGEED